MLMPSGPSKLVVFLRGDLELMQAAHRYRTSSYSRGTDGQGFSKDLWGQTMAIYEEQAPGVINLPILLGTPDKSA